EVERADLVVLAPAAPVLAALRGLVHVLASELPVLLVARVLQLELGRHWNVLVVAERKGSPQSSGRAVGASTNAFQFNSIQYSSLAGPGHFLCSPKESNQRKGIPGAPPLPRKLVADSTALLDRPGGLRNSRTASTLAITWGVKIH